MQVRKKTVLTILAAAVCCLSAVQATLAAWKASDSSMHAVSIASLSGRIIEQYEEATDVQAGQVVDKVVNVKNTGTADSVVRMRLEKAWGTGRTPEGALLVDSSYSADNILIECNTEYWYYNEEDGYYYYKGVLQPGETTVQPLFERFSVSKDTGGEYNGLTADILVKMECMQAAGNAISTWEMSFEELGITYTPAQPVNAVTEVHFIGKDDGFAFTPADTDLFTNFKDLLPGETRNQPITVTNSYAHPVEIFLRAEPADQPAAMPETQALMKRTAADTQELIDRLLREYVTAVVTAEDGTVIYSGPVWGNPTAAASNPESMRYDISLGTFSAGQAKNLTVQLMVDPQVDNQYQSLWGNIRWVWSAQGDDETTETPFDPPKTGDDSPDMYLYFGIMLVSGVLLLWLLRSREKEKKEGKRFNSQTK
jgi:LPXTG-motif cell wall-anchored protein